MPAEELGWSLALGREGLSGLPNDKKPAQSGFVEGWSIYPPCPIAVPSRTKFGRSCSFGLKRRFMSSGRQSCDRLPSKQTLRRLHFIFFPFLVSANILSDRSDLYQRTCYGMLIHNVKMERAATNKDCGSFFFVCRSPETRSHAAFSGHL
jgi:hypothetical protein